MGGQNFKLSDFLSFEKGLYFNALIKIGISWKCKFVTQASLNNGTEIKKQSLKGKSEKPPAFKLESYTLDT